MSRFLSTSWGQSCRNLEPFVHFICCEICLYYRSTYVTYRYSRVLQVALLSQPDYLPAAHACYSNLVLDIRTPVHRAAGMPGFPDLVAGTC